MSKFLAIGAQVPILGNGYLSPIDVWGSEERIIEAARMSTGKGFLGWGLLECSCGASSSTADFTGTGSDIPGMPRYFRDDRNTRCPTERGGAHVATPDSKAGDEKLLRYLWTHGHQTPFEMAGLTIEAEASIMVIREWFRHRVPFGYNEMSARYTPLPDVNYMPTVERLLVNSKTNKQAGTVAGSATLDEAGALRFQADLQELYEHAQQVYERALAAGVPKELARLPVPVGRNSRFRATSNLRGWLGFLKLRLPPTAQFEIRQYAEGIGEMISLAFPRTWRMFRGPAE